MSVEAIIIVSNSIIDRERSSKRPPPPGPGAGRTARAGPSTETREMRAETRVRYRDRDAGSTDVVGDVVDANNLTFNNPTVHDTNLCRK